MAPGGPIYSKGFKLLLLFPVDPGNAGEAIPVVASAFSPPREPEVALLVGGMWAGIHGATHKAGLVSLLEGSIIHIAFLSSHIRSRPGSLFVSP